MISLAHAAFIEQKIHGVFMLLMIKKLLALDGAEIFTDSLPLTVQVSRNQLSAGEWLAYFLSQA